MSVDANALKIKATAEGTLNERAIVNACSEINGEITCAKSSPLIVRTVCDERSTLIEEPDSLVKNEFTFYIDKVTVPYFEIE